MGKLEGKVAVITGSGRGIGKAIAKLFASEGASVMVNDIDESPALEVVKEIEAAGGKASACVADVTRLEEAQRLMDETVKLFGGLDILVNNAGITRDALIHKMTEQQWDLCININLKGTFNCIRAASKYFMKRGGRIINISSVVGLAGNVGQANYSAAKGGIIALTKTVAKEWARFGVNCNAVAYALVDTRLTQPRETGEEVFGEKVGIPAKLREAWIANTPLGRLMTPEEAARPVLFLASDDAAFITGHVLNVSGGWYM
ncbi:MAG: 3-oxoacyl-ACP reductase [Chloroflexi bacterium]|nr:MAG: 3-oxoacyl-ACP reductase [Chloroflexota bacterium]